MVFQNCLGIYKVGNCEVSQAGVGQETDIWTHEIAFEAENFHNMTKTDDKFFWMSVKTFSNSAFTANLWGIHCSFINLKAFFMGETKLLFIYVKKHDKDCTKIPDWSLLSLSPVRISLLRFKQLSNVCRNEGAKESAKNIIRKRIDDHCFGPQYLKYLTNWKYLLFLGLS